MKGIVLTFLALTIAVGIMADPLSCYDIQFTENPNGRSPYENQIVDIQAIVTAVKANNFYYLGDPDGGPWSGLYVYHRDSSNLVQVGDEVIVTGKVLEFNYNNQWTHTLTQITDVSNVDILSSGNPVPPAAILSTSELPRNNAISEKWEGVLVAFYNVQIKSATDSYGQFNIADTSNIQAMVDDGFFSIPSQHSIVVGDWWYVIRGMVDYWGTSSAGWKVNPRDRDDLIKEDSVANSTIRLSSDPLAEIDKISTLELNSTKLLSEWGVREYSFDINIDPAKVIYQGFDIDGTVTTAAPSVTVSSAGDVITFHYGSQDGIVSATDMILIKLKFEPKIYGEIPIIITNFKFDDQAISTIYNGRLQVKIQDNIAYLSIGTASSSKNSFDPSMNEVLNIEYGTKTGFLARALIRIYDAQGRLVATPVHQNFTSPTGIVNTTWNGRDSNMKLLEPGIYYCHTEISNRETSKRYTTVQPIVIKSRLK